MPLNLQVVNTAAVSVKLRLDSVDISGNPVTTNTPQHTHDKIYIDRVDMTIFDDLSAPFIPAVTAPPVPERNIYHRLALHMPADDANFVANSTLATESVGTRKVLNLIPSTETPFPLVSHNLQQATGAAVVPLNTGFTSPQNTFDTTGTPLSSILTTLIGTVARQNTAYTKTFRFDLQYQRDPMNAGIASGRLNNTNWNEYSHETDQNIIVSHSNGLTYRLRVTYSNADNDPAGGLHDRLWTASENINGGWVPSSSMNLNGTLYTPLVDQTTPYTTNASALLYTTYNSAGNAGNVVNPDIDYVLELADRDVDSIVDDVYVLTVPAKIEISIRDHLLYRQGGALIGTGSIKLFKGRTTRLHTDLHWQRVALTAYDLNINDDDVVLNGLSAAKVDLAITVEGPRGWFDFDEGQTRVGVGLDVNNRVFLQVKLGNASTGVNFDALYVNHVEATDDLMVAFNP